MKNWRTTIVGVLAGAYPIIDALLQAYTAGYFTEKTGSSLWVGIAFIAIGVLAKDHNVSGNSKNIQANGDEITDIGLPKPPKK